MLMTVSPVFLGEQVQGQGVSLSSSSFPDHRAPTTSRHPGTPSLPNPLPPPADPHLSPGSFHIQACGVFPPVFVNVPPACNRFSQAAMWKLMCSTSREVGAVGYRHFSLLPHNLDPAVSAVSSGRVYLYTFGKWPLKWTISRFFQYVSLMQAVFWKDIYACALSLSHMRMHTLTCIHTHTHTHTNNYQDVWHYGLYLLVVKVDTAL